MGLGCPYDKFCDPYSIPLDLGRNVDQGGDYVAAEWARGRTIEEEKRVPQAASKKPGLVDHFLAKQTVNCLYLLVSLPNGV